MKHATTVKAMRAAHSARAAEPPAAKPAKAPPAKINKGLAKTLAAVAKKYGDDALTTLAGGHAKAVAGIPTGWQELDDLLTGDTDEKNRTIAGSGVGLPRGRIIEVYGPESCLEASTFIQYEVRHPNGDRANHKGGSIERLYQRFHGLPTDGDGRGKYNREVTENCDFFAPSMNDEGRIFQNRIVDVVNTGRRMCYAVTTRTGQVIQATADHKFFNGDQFVPLKKLEVGTPLMLHADIPFTVGGMERASARGRVEWVVKHHPYAATKLVHDKARGYTNEYKRLSRARAVLEAALNAMTPDAYRDRLNASDLDGLTFLMPGTHVHHIDEDHTNDALENLVVLAESEHLREHAIERHNNLRYMVVADEITRIEPVGMQETYDVRMESPYNNYVANGIVVHNSGKTTLNLHFIAAVQKAGGVCAFIDAEHALDVGYAKKLGVDLSTLLISQPDSAEQALNLAIDLAKSGSVDFIVVDSVAALTPEAENDTDMEKSHVALQARLMSKGLRKLTPHLVKAGCVVVFINQVRMKIGVMFGNPETTSGGNSLKFYASIRIDIRTVKTLKKGDKPIGKRARIKIVKNKVAAPFREIFCDILPNRGIATVYGDPDFGPGDRED